MGGRDHLLSLAVGENVPEAGFLVFFNVVFP
jgi:hypothetical protein